MLHRQFPNVYEGWLVVGSSGAIVLVVAATFFYGFGTIFDEIRDEFGWSNASTALAFYLRNEMGGIGAVIVGLSTARCSSSPRPGAQLVRGLSAASST
jgi:hypothetical protein